MKILLRAKYFVRYLKENWKRNQLNDNRCEINKNNSLVELRIEIDPFTLLKCSDSLACEDSNQ
jgi:hypothetical protein